jgi:hypothetical protein
MELLGFREPFSRLFTQGMIYRNGAKMSKSKGNVVSPDEALERYGADALRLYILYMGPAEQDKEWSDAGIEGTARLVDRLWRRRARGRRTRPGRGADDGELVAQAHRRSTRSPTTSSALPFHTPIAALFELVNEIDARRTTRHGRRVRFATETVRSLMQPYAPHVAEELWERLGARRLWETRGRSPTRRCVASRRRRDRGAGERQAARPAAGPSGTPRTSSSRSRSARSAFARTSGRARRADDRRAGPARERRRRSRSLGRHGVPPRGRDAVLAQRRNSLVTGRARRLTGDHPHARAAGDGRRAAPGAARRRGVAARRRRRE